MAHRLLQRTIERRRVALLVESSMASGREIVIGIARYARECGSWSVYHEPGHTHESLPEWMRHWRGEGVIARVRTEPMATALASMGVPVVDVLDDYPHEGIGAVRVDNLDIARLALEHFLNRGFRQFAYCGMRQRRWAQMREGAFTALVEEAGYACRVYRLPPWNTPSWYAAAERQRLAEFVGGLPQPAAILACNDLTGQRVLDACRRAAIAVPESLAVLGVDNDQPLCQISDPVLSSIDPGYEQIGYQAAAILDRMMQGGSQAGDEVLWRPREVVVRRSTDVLAIGDADLAAAVRFIRDRACQGLQVGDVVRQVGLSYSTLKRRFRSVFGRSIHDEIVRIRLERARELLSGTELPIAVVARKSGFEHQESLGAAFKARFKQTPARYRRESRSSG